MKFLHRHRFSFLSARRFRAARAARCDRGAGVLDTLLNYIGLYAIVAIGLMLLTGIGGMTSFGQAAFVGVGAYATAFLTTQYAVSPWLALIAGVVITAFIALLLCLVTMRLSGHFLPLGTIAWGLSLFYLFGNMELLGKYDGINGIPVLSLFGWQLESGPTT